MHHESHFWKDAASRVAVCVEVFNSCVAHFRKSCKSYCLRQSFVLSICDILAENFILLVHKGLHILTTWVMYLAHTGASWNI